MVLSPKQNLLITLGDPAGIGPEIIAKCLTKKKIQQIPRITIIGDKATLFRYLPGGRLPKNCSLLDIPRRSKKGFQPAKSSLESAKASLGYLDEAIRLLKKNAATALATAPICKETISAFQKGFRGHTEYLAGHFGIKRYEMMFVAKNIKTVIVTRHIPLKDVSRAITKQKVVSTILLTHDVLKKSYKIKKPLLGVCGLNPHAGEGGLLGKEEIFSIKPAIRKAKERGVMVEGPFPADTLFYPKNASKYDAIIAMFHDQGLGPIKALYFSELVNVTIGLPFPRTSPAHGTAFDIAGKGIADPSSMLSAILLAHQLS